MFNDQIARILNLLLVAENRPYFFRKFVSVLEFRAIKILWIFSRPKTGETEI